MTNQIAAALPVAPPARRQLDRNELRELIAGDADLAGHLITIGRGLLLALGAVQRRGARAELEDLAVLAIEQTAAPDPRPTARRPCRRPRVCLVSRDDLAALASSDAELSGHLETAGRGLLLATRAALARGIVAPLDHFSELAAARASELRRRGDFEVGR